MSLPADVAIALRRAGGGAVLVTRVTGPGAVTAELWRRGSRLSAGQGASVRAAQLACVRYLVPDLLPSIDVT